MNEMNRDNTIAPAIIENDLPSEKTARTVMGGHKVK